MRKPIRLSDLPAGAVEQLKPLGHEEFSSLACQTVHQRDRDRWATYPRDPVEAARAAGEALRRPVAARVDDGLAEVSDSLRLANLILGREVDLDEQDCAALVWLLSRAEDLLHQEIAQDAEARDRFYRVGKADGEI